MAKTVGAKIQRGIKSVEKRIIPVGEAEPHLKALLYGRQGQGKTRTGAKAPGPVFILDCNEKGTKSIRRYPNAYVFQAKNWEDVNYAYWYLRDGDHEYKTVVVDTATQMQNLCMKQVLKEAEDRDPNRPPKTPSMRDWGTMGEYMRPMILNFRNLPMNVIFTAQVRNGKSRDDEDATDEWVPDLSPNPRQTLMAAVDVIGYVHQREVRSVDKKSKKEVSKWETRLLVGPSETYITKDRTGVLPRILRNPSITKIIEAASAAEEE